jgi:prefoldin subunit 5
MNAPTSSAAPDKSLPVHPDVEAEIRKLAEETIPKRPAQLESEVERIRSSITRLTSSSIDGLQELTSELQELQRFLNSEVQRVQGEIDGALAGINIIIDTIAPWKSSPASAAAATGARAVRPGGKY